MPPEKLPSREIPKQETENSVEQQKQLIKLQEKEFLSTAIKKALETTVLLFGNKGRESEITDYLLAGHYKTGKNPDLDRVLDQICLYHIQLKKVIEWYISPLFAKSAPAEIKPSPHPQNKAPEVKETGFLDKIATGAKTVVNTVSDAVVSGIDKAGDLLKDFYTSISKLVSIDGIPNTQIPILKAMIEGGQKAFDKVYKMWWTGATIDCSGFVSLMLRAWRVFKSGQYLTSSGLYSHFSREKMGERVLQKSAKAWDLLFRGKWWWNHVEMIVGKPYYKKWVLYVKTLWSSSDTINVSPMFNIDGTPTQKKNGVAYRERKLKETYQIIRPHYESIVSANEKKKA